VRGRGQGIEEPEDRIQRKCLTFKGNFDMIRCIGELWHRQILGNFEHDSILGNFVNQDFSGNFDIGNIGNFDNGF
jgi:hypothetical protein